MVWIDTRVHPRAVRYVMNAVLAFELQWRGFFFEDARLLLGTFSNV